MKRDFVLKNLKLYFGLTFQKFYFFLKTMKKIQNFMSNFIAMKVLLKKILIIVFLIPISCLKNLDSKIKEYQLAFLINLTLTDLEFSGVPNSFFEGMLSSFQIKLKVKPADSLHIPVNISHPNFVQPYTSFIIISPENWNQWHTVYYYVVEDEYYEKNQNLTLLVGPVQTSDSVFNGKFYSFDKQYINNDINSASYWIYHPYEDSYNGSIGVNLTSKPRDNVTVNLNLEPNSDVSLSTTSLTFTPSNYNTVQNIALSYVSDTLIEFTESFPLTISTSSSDPDYNNLQYQTNVLVYDNDIPDISFNTGLNITEGSITSVGMSLGAPPSSNVTVNLTTNDPSICTISGSTSFLFTNTNYNSYQYFTVQAKPADNVDNLSDNSNCIITATATSSDPNYNNMVRTLVGSIYDLNNSGINSLTSLGFLYESGTTIINTLKLTSKPTDSVKVCIKVNNYCEAFIESTGINAPDGSCNSIAGANTPYVIFDSLNWNTGFTINVTGRHDWEYRPGGSPIPETGGSCTGPYPDGTKIIQVILYTQCSNCNSFEQLSYNSGTSPAMTIINGTVFDDLDKWMYATPSHNGDFANDTNLSGANEIEKADYYCELNKPSFLSGTFKAFLSSPNRKCDNALCASSYDWVLFSNKYYFRYEDGQLAYKTFDSQHVFNFTFPYNQGFLVEPWTGLDQTSSWQNVSLTPDCNDWGNSSSLSSGNIGSANNNDYSGVSSGSTTCDSLKPIICIQQ